MYACDKRPVGLGLPLAGADVQGVLVVDEQIEFIGGASAAGIIPVERVRQGFIQAVIVVKTQVSSKPKKDDIIIWMCWHFRSIGLALSVFKRVCHQ